MLVYGVNWEMVEFKKLLVVFLLFMFCLPIFAANWKQYSEKGWYDISTWRQNGNIKSAWFKDLNDGTFKPYDNKKVWYQLAYIEANCSQRLINVKHLNIYGVNGELLDSVSWSIQDWEDIVPETRGELKYYVLCNLR